jgi:hypothetical protein
MRISGSISWCVLLCSITLGATACKEGNVDFDANFDDEDAAVTHGGKDASVNDDDGGADTGATDQDASTAATDAGSMTSTVSQVATTLATATCDGMMMCRNAALLTDALGDNDCVTSFARRSEDDQLHFLQASIDAKRVAFDASALSTCSKDLADFGCDVRTRRLPASCEKALAGKVALGGSCDLDLDCADDAFCDKGTSSDNCPGKCKSTLGESSVCQRSSQCADGLQCTGKTCKKLGGEGDSCAQGTAPCGLAFVCRTETAGAVCRSLASVYSGAKGDSCGPSTTYCAQGLVCASMSKTVGQCQDPVAAGAACRRAVPSQCPTDQYCSAVNPGDTGTCMDLPASGSACLTNHNQVCASGLICVSDVCQAMGRPGDACDDATQCYSGACVTSICVTPVQCKL